MSGFARDSRTGSSWNCAESAAPPAAPARIARAGAGIGIAVTECIRLVGVKQSPARKELGSAAWSAGLGALAGSLS